MARTKSIDPIDQMVGRNVRIRRSLIGMTQIRLGELCNPQITFQQIQKYEKGLNRISASRIWQIATALGVSVQSLFDGVAEDELLSNSLSQFDGLTHHDIEFIRLYLELPLRVRVSARTFLQVIHDAYNQNPT
ncbi:MAG: helix-turn-helix transcriptional regulator [Pseudomonadota bacterium]